MKKTAVLLSALMIVSLPPAAEAKGCIKGAIVGGIVGHYAGHHGVLGAIGGCLYGRHEANKRHERATRQPRGEWGRTYARAPRPLRPQW